MADTPLIRLTDVTRIYGMGDAELRALLASCPMEGKLRTLLLRELDYFLGCSTMGRDIRVLTARERESGKLAMTAATAAKNRVGQCRSVRSAESAAESVPFSSLQPVRPCV